MPALKLVFAFVMLSVFGIAQNATVAPPVFAKQLKGVPAKFPVNSATNKTTTLAEEPKQQEEIKPIEEPKRLEGIKKIEEHKQPEEIRPSEEPKRLEEHKKPKY